MNQRKEEEKKKGQAKKPTKTVPRIQYPNVLLPRAHSDLVKVLL